MKFTEPNVDTLSSIKEDFVTLDAANAIVKKADEQATSKKPALSELHEYAAGKLPFPNQTIEEALAKSPGLRAAYRRIIMSSATHNFEVARAASEGDLATRRTHGATISFTQSSAHQDRVYIVIELTTKTETPPKTMTVFDENNEAVRLELPKIQENVIQVLVKRTSEIIKALENINTSVVLT